MWAQERAWSSKESFSSVSVRQQVCESLSSRAFVSTGFSTLNKHTRTFNPVLCICTDTHTRSRGRLLKSLLRPSCKTVKMLAALCQLAFLLHNLFGNIYLLWATKKNPGFGGKANEQINPCGITLAAFGHAAYLNKSLPPHIPVYGLWFNEENDQLNIYWETQSMLRFPFPLLLH